MIAFVVVAMTVAAASEVSLTVEPSTPCVERGRIVSALQGKGLRVRETPGAETLLVRVTSSGGAVEVRGTQRERKLERRVPVGGAACPAVERIVVALIESWANMTRPAMAQDAGTSSAVTLRLDGGATTRGDAAENARADAQTASFAVSSDGGERMLSASGQSALARSEDAGVRSVSAPSSGRKDDGGAQASTSVTARFSAGERESFRADDAGAGTQVTALSPAGEREKFSADAGAAGTQATPSATALSPTLSPAGEMENFSAGARNAGTQATPPATALSPTLSPAGERENFSADAGAAGTQATPPATALSPPLSPAGQREKFRADAGSAATQATALSPAEEREELRVDAGTAGTQEKSPLRLDVAVLGGATIDASGLPAGTGSLVLRGAIGRWGLLVDAAMESARTNTIAPVTASATQQTLSASFSVEFEPTSSLTLDVALGLRGWRVEATSTGGDASEIVTNLRWGGVLSAGLAWRVTGPLFLTARGAASVRDKVIHLNVPPLEPVLSLNPWNFGLQGGVLVRFD